MKFEIASPIEFPRPAVFAALQHNLADLAPLLPNIDRVDTVEASSHADGRDYTLHHWHATPDMAPALIWPFVSTAMTQWLDYGYWDQKNWSIEWRFESPKIKGMYHCGGTHRLLERSATTCTLIFAGELAIDPAKVPGIPVFVAKKAAPLVEKFLLDLILNNLERLPKAVNMYLGQRERP